MPTDYSKFIDVIAALCDERDIKYCVTQSFKGGLLTGCSAAVGGILLGPVGLAIGGAVGGAAAALSNKGNFKPISSIIRSLPPKKQEELYCKVKMAIQGIDPLDVAAVAGLLLANRSVSEVAIKEVQNYLSKEMNVKFTS